jgi:hypothetical protein
MNKNHLLLKIKFIIIKQIIFFKFRINRAKKNRNNHFLLQKGFHKMNRSFKNVNNKDRVIQKIFKKLV